MLLTTCLHDGCCKHVGSDLKINKMATSDLVNSEISVANSKIKYRHG